MLSRNVLFGGGVAKEEVEVVHGGRVWFVVCGVFGAARAQQQRHPLRKSLEILAPFAGLES